MINKENKYVVILKFIIFKGIRTIKYIEHELFRFSDFEIKKNLSIIIKKKRKEEQN